MTRVRSAPTGGVFMSYDDGASWLHVSNKMQTVSVLDLRHHATSNTLTVATFGHGIQRAALP
jgi:hypothetical protein